MQKNPHYKNIIKEIKDFLRKQSSYAIEKGIKKENIIVDPGIGFGKRTGSGIEDNCTILANISEFKKLGYPVLIGASRKTFIGNISCEKDLSKYDRIEGSTAAAVISSMNGADIVRVHDVKETVNALKVLNCVKNSN